MDNEIIYSDQFVRISKKDDEVYIESAKKGFPFEQLNQIFSLHPEISITNYTVLKNAVNFAPRPAEKFGMLKGRIIVETVENDLKAMITFNLSKQELDNKNREKLINEAAGKLREAGVVFGIKKTLFSEELHSGKPYVIAAGIPPVNGTDAVIRMYQLKETKPEIHEDGKANYYDLKLINKVNAGEWLGERLEATEGTPGTSVKGTPIKAMNGKTLPLSYDRNTVKEETEGNVTRLYARISGAVNYIGDKITVSNHLEIDGNVDFKTGNIKFDGYLTIKGTVSDGFSVEATRDIEINGQLGLGNIKEISSIQGSIFVRGGIAAKGKAEIRAAKNVFTKFVDNASIVCGGAAHIGFYCVNSNINAKEIIIDSPKGQIIGGSIRAEIKVTTALIGSEMEKRSIVEVTGFDREALKEDLVHVTQKIEDLKLEQQKLKQTLSGLDQKDRLNSFQRREYDDSFERILAIKEELREFEEKRKNISGYLRARGEGEICVTKKIYPNCMLIIKRNVIEVTSPETAASIFVQNSEIKRA